QHGVVHGGLRPTNILMKEDGTACVSDYGMVEVQSSGGDGYRYFSPEAWKGVRILGCFSLAPPAEQAFKTLSRSSDVFAWGMSALQIFTSKPPWGILTEKQIFAFVVQEHTRPDRPDEDFGLTDHIWYIIQKCWERDSRQRP
ncbi:kinase-like domain-containing protein, partial [Mycena metata]